jgi:hypothetical protein
MQACVRHTGLMTQIMFHDITLNLYRVKKNIFNKSSRFEQELFLSYVNLRWMLSQFL